MTRTARFDELRVGDVVLVRRPRRRRLRVLAEVAYPGGGRGLCVRDEATGEESRLPWLCDPAMTFRVVRDAP